jgi:hypothetical protein
VERLPRHRHRVRQAGRRGRVGPHSQTINLAPSQGGWVEFTLDQEGNYPFVTHSFADMSKGALGVLATENAPKASAEGAAEGPPGTPATT